MMHKSFFALALVGVTLAAPLEHRTTTPTATIENGVVVGTTSGGIDSFSGIPFAQPPVGDLRLRAPQSYSATFPSGTYAATSAPPACPQFDFEVNYIDTSDVPSSVLSDVLGSLLDSPLGEDITDTSEDCLYLTVQRPAGTTSADSLPVLFWIFGGGFVAGSSATYYGANIIGTSVDLGQPIVYVAVNYRLGGYGFLHGKELAAENATNLGLRDQRLGLEWASSSNVAKTHG